MVEGRLVLRILPSVSTRHFARLVAAPCWQHASMGRAPRTGEAEYVVRHGIPAVEARADGVAVSGQASTRGQAEGLRVLAQVAQDLGVQRRKSLRRFWRAVFTLQPPAPGR